jgi:hypothetical protein
MLSGGLGAFVSNPADKIQVEFQTDKLRKKSNRNNYKSVLEAAQKMVAQDGVGVLFKGAVSNIARSAMLTAG